MSEKFIPACITCIHGQYLENCKSWNGLIRYENKTYPSPGQIEVVCCQKFGQVEEKDECEASESKPNECLGYDDCFKSQCQPSLELFGEQRPFERNNVIMVCPCIRWNGKNWVCNFHVAKRLNRSVKPKKPPIKKDKSEIITIAGMNFKQRLDSLQQGEDIVLINVEKLDKEWEKDIGRYIPKNNLPDSEKDQASQDEKSEMFKEFLQTGETVEMSIVFVREGWEDKKFTDSYPFDSIIRFRDGRHKFSILRDMGFKTLPISTDSGSAEIMSDLFGEK
jgi:hypothetical protein